MVQSEQIRKIVKQVQNLIENIDLDLVQRMTQSLEKEIRSNAQKIRIVEKEELSVESQMILDSVRRFCTQNIEQIEYCEKKEQIIHSLIRILEKQYFNQFRVKQDGEMFKEQQRFIEGMMMIETLSQNTEFSSFIDEIQSI